MKFIPNQQEPCHNNPQFPRLYSDNFSLSKSCNFIFSCKEEGNGGFSAFKIPLPPQFVLSLLNLISTSLFPLFFLKNHNWYDYPCYENN